MGITARSRFLVLALATTSFCTPVYSAPTTSPSDLVSLEAGFRNPPLRTRPQTWWHWENGNITKEGIKADLEDMKRVGLAGAHLFDVDTKFPAGPVRYGSDAWFDHVNYAIKTAESLDLTLVLHNCPGWSTTGGPWVGLEDSMKKLVWSETEVTGAQKLNLKLDQPQSNLDFYRDIAVLAVPADPADDDVVPQVTGSIQDLDLSNLTDGDRSTAINLPEKTSNPVFTFAYPQPVTKRLLQIQYPFSEKGVSIFWNAGIEVSVDGVNFKKLRTFTCGGMLFRGGDVTITVPFESTTATVFRLSLTGGQVKPLNISEMKLSNAYRMENYQGKSGNSSIGRLTPYFGSPVNDPAAIPGGQVIDLTSGLSADGMLTANLPAGKWTVLRFGYTTTGMLNHPSQAEGTGFEIDKMDAKVAVNHFQHSLGRILKEAGDSAGKTVTGILIDSWEAKQQNWTKNFPAEFSTRRGYSMMPFLPALTGRVVGSLADSEAFLRDFRLTINELIAENNFRPMREQAAQHGLKLYLEAYGGRAFDEFLGGAEADVNLGEFWYGEGTGRIKITSSLAHTTGKKYVAAESYTTTVKDACWTKAPFDFKPYGDAAFSQGLNLTLLHTYAHQPRNDMKPGFTLGSAGSNFGRLNTWWPLARSWIDYMARCQYLLQQGGFVADFLLFRNTDMGSFVDDRYPALPDGTDYDQIIAKHLLAATAENGKIRLPSGAQYRLLVLPNDWVADTATLKHLKKLAETGAVIVGDKPSAPAGRADLGDEWNRLVADLWKNSETSPVKPESSFSKLLAQLHIEPDFVCTTDPQAPVNYIHRRTATEDIYFLCTTSAVPVAIDGDFRVAGKQPELWDPASGRVSVCPVFDTSGTRTKVRLSLDAVGSAFVVFRRPLPAQWFTACMLPDGKAAALGRELDADAQGALWSKVSGTFHLTANTGGGQNVAVEKVPAVLPVESEWAVTFNPAIGEAFTRQMTNLQSLAKSTENALKYFSGSAVYKTEFSVPAETLRKEIRCILNLGDVYDVAEVRVNGMAAGMLWKPPFMLDMTALLQPGINQLEVTVANKWVNRLMAETKLPSDAQYQTKSKSNPSGVGLIESFPAWYNDPSAPRTRSVFMTYCPYYSSKAELPDSGLAGPVQIRFLAKLPVKN